MKNLFVSFRFTWLPTLAVLFAGLSMVNVSKAAHPLDDLETRYPLPTTQELNDAVYGNGTWVVTGKFGTILTSADATNWQVGNVGRGSDLRGVIFVNNMFIAAGGARVFSSTDGVNWTEIASGLGNIDAGIAYGDGLYIVAGTFGNIRASVDLINWTILDPGHTKHFKGIAFAAGRFVVVGTDGTITQAAVGETLVTTTPTTFWLNDVVFANNMFVVCGHSGTILTSADGISWTDQGSIGSSALLSIKYGDGVFVASGNYSGNPTPYQVYRSTNGIDWTGVSKTRLLDFTDGGGYGNGKFILLSRNFIETSTDGLTWEFSSSTPRFLPKFAEYIGGKFIGAGDTVYGFVGTSDDGLNWTAQDSSSTGFIRTHIDATSGNGKFLVCGRDNTTFAGYIITTQNGVDWSLGYTAGTDQATGGGIWGVDYGNGKYLACGERGRILFSDDASTWEEKQFLGTPQQLRGMSFGAGLYVVVGDGGLIMTSPDGGVWTPQTSGVTSRLEDIAFHANRFVAVASDSRTMITSTDGINWSEIETETVSFPRRIKVINGEFVVNGFVSSDGITWSQHSFGGEVVYNGSNYFTFSTSIRSTSSSVQDLIIDRIARQGNNLIIEWSNGGILQSRIDFSAGDWEDVDGAANPHQFDPDGIPLEVFRLRSD